MNVGKPRCIYRALVVSPSGVNVSVVPKVLAFARYGQKMSFTVRLKAVAPPKGYVFGSLTWKSARIEVTSPLVVRVAISKPSLS